MNFLIIYVEDSAKFDKDAVLTCLREIAGVSNIREGELVGSIIECDFEYVEDTTIVRLRNDLMNISINGTGEASLQAALEIQRQLSLPLHVIDSDYAFDINLKDAKSLSQLKSMISDLTGL